MSNELEGRQWFTTIIIGILIACGVIALAGMESIVELAIGWWER